MTAFTASRRAQAAQLYVRLSLVEEILPRRSTLEQSKKHLLANRSEKLRKECQQREKTLLKAIIQGITPWTGEFRKEMYKNHEKCNLAAMKRIELYTHSFTWGR